MIRAEYFSDSRGPHHNRVIGDFVSEHCFERPGQFDKYSTMGVFDDGELIAGTVFHNWHPDAGVLELSSASVSRRWLTPAVIRAMMAFPFDLMECQMIVMRVSERNEAMVRIAQRFGFDGVKIRRLRGRDEAEWIFTMTEEDWRNHPVAIRGEVR